MLMATLWNTGARLNEALTRGDFIAGTALPVRAAVHAETVYRKSCQNGWTLSGQQSDSLASSVVRYSLRQPAGDDGGHRASQ